MKEPMKLGFLMAKTLDVPKRSRIKGLSEDYRPYRHKSRTLSLSRQVGDNQNVNNIDAQRSKVDRNIVFYCHLSPDWQS